MAAQNHAAGPRITAMEPGKVSDVLRRAGARHVSPEGVRANIDAGAPVNEDGGGTFDKQGRDIPDEGLHWLAETIGPTTDAYSPIGDWIGTAAPPNWVDEPGSSPWSYRGFRLDNGVSWPGPSTNGFGVVGWDVEGGLAFVP